MRILKSDIPRKALTVEVSNAKFTNKGFAKHHWFFRKLISLHL